MTKQNYSEKEVARIIKRAAELESKQSDINELLNDGPGLSLDELSSIAVEAGLDPENVRKAANELSPSPQGDTQNATVNNDEVIYEQWITGDFTDEIADLVIADLNHRYNTTHEKTNWKDNILHDASTEPDRQSKVTRTGKSLEWKKLNKHGADEIQVLIQPRNDQVRIRVTKHNIMGGGFIDRNDSSGYLSYIPYLAGLIMIVALPNSFLYNMIFGIITFAILQFTLKSRLGWVQKKLSGSKDQKLESYRSEVQTIARDLAKLIETPSTTGDRIDIGDQSEIRTGNTESGGDSNSNRTRNRFH
jgi:hypothetical protein